MPWKNKLQFILYPQFLVLIPTGNDNNLVCEYLYFSIFLKKYIYKKLFHTLAFNKSLEFRENKSYAEPLEINNNRATCMASHV